MAENELRIDVVVNDADLEKLSTNAQRVAQGIEGLIAQFTKGKISSQELASGIQSQVDAFLKSYPGITGQTAALAELTGIQKNLAAAARETAADIQDASTKAGSSADYYRRLAGEQIGATTTATELKTATGALSQSIAALAPAATSGAAGLSRLTAAAGEAGIAVEGGSAEINAAQASYGEAGMAASELATAMVENSQAVQVTGTRYAALARDLEVATVALDEAKEAMLQTGLTEEQNTEVIAAHSKALAEHRMLQMQTTAAEKDLKNALAESYTEQVKLAAARADTAAQTQAASQSVVDAKDKEAASYERNRAVEAELAEREAATIKRLQEKSDAAKNTAAVNEQTAASSRNVTEATNANTAANAQNAASYANLSNAARLLDAWRRQEGVTLKDAQSMLRNYGYTEKEVTAATNELGLATQKMGVETEVASTKIDQMTGRLAYSTVRVGSNLLGVGQLGFAFARLAQVSAALAPILAAAFPVIAIFAFIDVLENVGKKISEWSDLSLKAAEDTAKFTREMQKGAEAVAQMDEKLAGLIGPLAEDAERMANLASKTADITASTKAVNAELDNYHGKLMQIVELVSKGLVEAYHAFDSADEDALRGFQKFNEQVAASVTKTGDYATALKMVEDEIKKVRAEHEYAMAHGGLAAFDPEDEARFERALALEEKFATDLKNRVEAQGKELLALQESMNQKLLAAEVSTEESRIAQEETLAKQRLGLHEITETQMLTQQIHFDEERTKNALRALENEERLLAERKKARPGVDYSAEELALAQKRTKILTDEATKIYQQSYETNQKQLADSMALGNAQIAASEAVALAYAKQEEAQRGLRAKFTLADTPAAVEAATKELIEATTYALELQIKALKERAEVEIRPLPETTRLPKAELGTEQYAKDLSAISEIPEKIKEKLLKLNEEIIVATANAATKTAEIREEGAAKAREIGREALTNELADLKDQQIAVRETYQEQESVLKNLLTERKINEQTFYDASVALAKTNAAELQDIYDKQTLDLVDARAAGLETEQQFQKKLLAIWKEEELAHKQMMTREEQAAKEAIDKEEAEIKKVTDKISSEFVKMGQTLLTTHTSVGRAAMQLGRDLELYIIEQGIKKVVEKWTTSLLQMLAEHNSILTKILGIHVLVQQQEATATTISQAEQTAAVKAGAAAQQEVTLITALKDIEAKAHDAAVGAYNAVVGIPVIGPVLAPAAAAAAFVGAMAWAGISGAEGGMVVPSAAAGMTTGTLGDQPVLVHSGEVIMHQSSLRALSAAPSAATGMIARVSGDQVTRLAPGTVVVPRVLASGLLAATPGSISTAPGVPVPLGVREEPQRLPQEMGSMIRDIINVRGGEGGFLSAAGGVSIPMIAGGPAMQSAAAGIAVPTAHAPLSLPAMHPPTIGGATTIHSGGSRTQVNNLRLEYHSHGPAGVQKEEIVGLVRRAIRTGALG